MTDLKYLHGIEKSSIQVMYIHHHWVLNGQEYNVYLLKLWVPIFVLDVVFQLAYPRAMK